MFSIIENDQFRDLKAKHQARLEQHPLMNAILSGVQRGFVYAESATSAIFICARAGFCLLSAPKEQPVDFYQDFWRFLESNRHIPHYLHFYGPPPGLVAHVAGQTSNQWLRRRVQFRCYRSVPTFEYQQLLPPKYRISPIQEVGCERLERAFHVRSHDRYWNSADDFLNKAIGVCVVDETDSPVAICYSACVVDGVAEMDTFVAPEHRGRRLMRIVSEPFFNRTMANGLIPHWDTFESNVPSYILAQKFQLSRVHDYDLLSVILR